MRMGVALAIYLGLIGGSGPAHAAWVVEDRAGVSAEFDGENLRIEDAEGVVIINSKEGTITVVAKPLKTFATSSVKSACTTVRQLAKFGPPKKANFRRLSVIAKDAGRGPRVGQIGTTSVILERDGKLSHELLTVSDPGFRRVLSEMNLSPLFELEECGIGWTARIEGRIGSADPIEQTDAFRSVFRRGWVLKKFDKRANRVAFEAVRVRERPTRANAFRPPKGFKKVPFRKMVKVIVNSD